jgi:hypothetical protein
MRWRPPGEGDDEVQAVPGEFAERRKEAAMSAEMRKRFSQCQRDVNGMAGK